MHYDFDKDIRDGDVAEKRVMDMFLQKCDSITSFDHNNDNRYDWKISLDNGRCVTVEVKNDIRSRETGNFAFETRCRGKESGVNVTVADLFVMYCGEGGEEHAYCFRTCYLKKIVDEWDLKTVAGGDVGRDGKPVTEMVLVPKRMLSGSYSDIAKMEKVDLNGFSLKQ